MRHTVLHTCCVAAALLMACDRAPAASSAPATASAAPSTPALTTICRYHEATLLGPQDTYYTQLAHSQGPIEASPPERIRRLREVRGEGAMGLWWRANGPGEVVFRAPGAPPHRVRIAAPADIDRAALVGPTPENTRGALPIQVGIPARFDVVMWRGPRKLCNRLTTPMRVVVSPASRCALRDPADGDTTSQPTFSVLAKTPGACAVSITLPALRGGQGVTIDAELEAAP